MPRSLRFTGENPPVDVLAGIPNWVNAYDEEDIEGQDETTLKPEDCQDAITLDTTFTAGDIRFADGSVFSVLINLLDSEVCGFSIYQEPEWPYLTRNHRSNRWSVLPDYGSADREHSARWWRSRSFPAVLSSRLRWAGSGERLEILFSAADDESEGVA